MFKKYQAHILQVAIHSLQFRAEMITHIVLDAVPFVVVLFIWLALFQNTATIQNFTFPQIVEYYLLALIIERCTASHFESWRSQEIREGKIDYYLTKPFSYLHSIVAKDIGGKIVSILLSIPIFMLLILLLQQIFSFQLPSFSLGILIPFVLFLLFAYAMQTLIALWIVLLTFWFEGSDGLEHFKWITISLFSGAMLPYTFMPEWLQTAFDYLPFKYLYAVPIGIAQQQLTISASLLLGMSVTLVTMVLCTKLLWIKAVRVYCSAGGLNKHNEKILVSFLVLSQNAAHENG